MRRALRTLLTLVASACLVASLCLAAMYARSADTTDVLMLAVPGDHCLLVNSHEGGWVEITRMDGWPDRGLGWWSARRNVSRAGGANTWNEAGPFKFWQNHATTAYGPVWYVHGRLAVPTDDNGRLPAYGDGYARADATNAWAGVIPSQPGWLWTNGWEIRCPHMLLIALTAGLAALVFLPRVVSWVRRRGRSGVGLCPTCGYDLRASPGRCPECGTPAAAATA